MIAVTVVLVALLLVAAGTGLLLFNRSRRRDRLVVSICHLFELESRRESEESTPSGFRHALVSELKKTQTDFDFAQFTRESDVDRKVAREVAEDVFRDYFERALIDGVISRREAVTLNTLAELLHLSTDAQKSIMRQALDSGSGG